MDFNKFFDDLNEMISNGFKKTKPKRKYTKRTIKVKDEDIITEFHPEYLFNIFN